MNIYKNQRKIFKIRHRNVLRCAGCGGIIRDAYYRFKGLDAVYCTNCVNNRERCFNCGLPVGIKYWELSDGRFICNSCIGKIVIDSSKARVLFRRVREVLSNSLDLKVKHGIKIHIVDREFLSKISKSYERNSQVLGIFKYTRRGDYEIYEIYVLYGLSEALTVATMGHELAHVWCKEKRIKSLDDDEEAFATWVGYIAMKLLGYQKEAKEYAETNGITLINLNDSVDNFSFPP